MSPAPGAIHDTRPMVYGPYGSSWEFHPLIPYRAPTPPLPAPPPAVPSPPGRNPAALVRVRSEDARMARGTAVVAGAFGIATLFAAVAGNPVGFLFLALTIAIGTVAAVFVSRAQKSGWWAEPVPAQRPYPVPRLPGGNTGWRDRHAAVIYHRRYVVPRTDIDRQDWQVWTRATAAAARIARSEVARQGRIDLVYVAAVPSRLWDIAERLARLADARASQQAILRKIAADDPDIAATVGRQRHAQELAARDVEKRALDLEVYADLVAKADAAVRKEAIVAELAGLNYKHLDLLAGTGETALDEDLTERMTQDAQLIIEQAKQAIQEVNEAGRSLLPDPEEDTRANGT